MKKNTSKKPYKIKYKHRGINCNIDIFYHEIDSHFHFIVLANELMEPEDLKIIEYYLESEGFYEDAKKYYDDLDEENIFYKDKNTLKNKKNKY